MSKDYSEYERNAYEKYLLRHTSCKEVRIDYFMNKASFYPDKKMIHISFIFGDSFTISIDDKAHTCKMNYKNFPMLRVLSRDLDFLLSYIEAGCFKVNKAEFPFNKDETDFSNFDLEKEKARLVFAQRSVKVLDMLGCKADLDITKLTNEDVRNLERLAVAFIDKEPVSGLNPDLPPVATMSISGLKFALLFKKCEAEGVYSIYDFFKSELSVAYDGENGEKISTSQFVILHKDDLLTVQNIQPQLFLPSFQKIKTEDKYTRANFFLLELLNAYDKSDDQRKDLLKAADEMSEWLCEAPEQYLDYHIKYLNRLQVLKRERELTLDEVAQLWSIAEDNSAANMSKLGAYLLLEQQVPAERYFSKLDVKTQEEFKTYPIYRYFKKAEETKNGQA